MAKAWWDAFALGDVASLENASTDNVSFTASNGRTFGRRELLAEAATHHLDAKIRMEWHDELVRQPAPAIAVFTTRVTEAVGPKTSVYRYLAVLQCSGEKWRVSAAQSTRELASTPRTSVSEESLEEFTGNYATPAGKKLQIVLKDSALVLVDPNGGETKLEPVGPSLFEAPGVSFQGLIRFLFARDDTGRITSLSRMTSDITTFPRVD